MAKHEVITRLVREAAEALETEGITRVGLKCKCCKDKAIFIDGDLRVFFEVYYGKECANKNQLMFLVTE